ncbi:hypothetical protein C4D60_Mb02t17390 [Musa balbisiana]|uniref:Uncharacterized protein n=1 Tax=Musa balbisiana TaxID=52838 RepID=A0A4V4H2R4_MUSBA|nr:hypothetical protein C4D60_Mb02t17390 [Musa balbisiana]
MELVGDVEGEEALRKGGRPWPELAKFWVDLFLTKSLWNLDAQVFDTKAEGFDLFMQALGPKIARRGMFMRKKSQGNRAREQAIAPLLMGVLLAGSQSFMGLLHREEHEWWNEASTSLWGYGTHLSSPILSSLSPLRY